MKMYTHFLFSMGLILLVLSLFFKVDFFNEFAIALSISYIGNSLIDLVGHKEVIKESKEMLVRTPTSHTFPRSVAWGVLSSSPILTFVVLFSHYYLDLDSYTLFSYIASVIIGGIIVGPSHMLLDVFTQKGIFRKRNGQWVRFALAHRRYNDPLANGIAATLGILMLLFSIWEFYSNYILYIYHYLLHFAL